MCAVFARCYNPGLGGWRGTDLAHADASTAVELDAPGVEQCEHQIRRILQSATFRNATTLQQLLQFLAAKTIAGEPEALKEYTIGVEALGRRQDFDPKTDPIVRVQSHRLRLKLKEYYDLEGNHDPIVIQIPKGHYVPRFEAAALPVTVLDHGSAVDPVTPDSAGLFKGSKTERGHSVKQRESRRFRWLVSTPAAIAAGAIVAFVLGWWAGNRQVRTGFGAEAASANLDLDHGKSPDPVRVFWQRFLGNDTSPVIAYTDAVFLLDDSNDLFRFRQGASDGRGSLVDPHLARQFASNPELVAKAGQLYYENGYTGTGELESIAMLAGLFGRMGARPIIKSSRDVNPDDLKQHNVILLGSPFQNTAVAQLLTVGDFAFRNPDSRHEQWRGQILNAHPRANEEPIYRTERDSMTHVLKTDYSLISIMPGVVPGRYIAVLGGLDTKGTEGATMFATSKPGIEELNRTLSQSGEPEAKGETPVFQALVRVRLSKGYQVLEAGLVTVHGLYSSNPNRPGSAPSSGTAR